MTMTAGADPHAEPEVAGDPETSFLVARGAADRAHSHGRLLDHLDGTAGLLAAWGARPALVRAGRFHSAYDVGALATAADRDELRGLLGPEAEALVWTFRNVPAQKLVDALLAGDPIPGATPDQRTDLCDLTIANWFEQRPRVPFATQVDFMRAACAIADHASPTVRAAVDLAAEVLPADFSCRRHFANNHRVVRVRFADDAEPASEPVPAAATTTFEPADVVGDADALAAIVELGWQLRALGYDNTVGCGDLGRLVLAHPVEAASLRARLGSGAVDALLASGFLRPASGERSDGGAVTAAYGVLAVRSTLVALPREANRPDQVYLGSEALLLDHVRAALAPAPARAIDLGTGAGLAGVLAGRRAGALVLTDLLDRATAGARLTWALNDDAFRARTSVVRADVAGGLRPGSAGFVSANAPYIPTDTIDAGADAVFAAGGPTGSELPTRFLREGATLLAPGGVLAQLTLDTTLADGRRPIRSALDELASGGFGTAVLETPYRFDNPSYAPTLLAGIDDWVEVRHVAAIVVRPGPGRTSRAAVEGQLAAARASLAGLGWR